MIKVQGSIPRNIAVAVSGGVDSVALLDFLSKNHKVTVLHVDHGTANGEKARTFVESLCADNQHELLIHTVTDKKPANQSYEEFWRNERYSFFHSYQGTVITGHHLNDCVETWIWSSMHGEGKIIPYANKNVIRPFRATKKADFLSWAQRKDLCWVEDESNKDTSYTRNYIRHEAMPHMLRINPGLEKVIKKKVLKWTS